MSEQYGADALRLYELFMGPLEESCDWDTSGVAGTRRFLDRVWRLAVETDGDGNDTGRLNPKLSDVDGKSDRALERALHSAIKRVTEGVEHLRFNTAISEMMVFVNEATRAEVLPRAWLETFLLVLSPFAPHLCEELWHRLGRPETLAYEPWPAYDERALAVDTITIAVQVAGKTRGTIEVPADVSEGAAIAAAKADPKIARHLEGKTIRREIYVPGRLVNLVAT
jgi:leucyl-tRNA synthetase